MGAGEGGPAQNLVKFQTVARLNAIMVVSSRPDLLRTAATWIARLDKTDTASSGVKVYRVKYGDAKQLAGLAQRHLHRALVRRARFAGQPDRARRRPCRVVQFTPDSAVAPAEGVGTSLERRARTADRHTPRPRRVRRR